MAFFIGLFFKNMDKFYIQEFTMIWLMKKLINKGYEVLINNNDHINRNSVENSQPCDYVYPQLFNSKYASTI